MSRQKTHVILVAAMAAAAPFARAGGTVDGTRGAGEYTFTLGVQNTPTGFGDNLNELNAAFADVLSDGSVRLMLTGNLEQNGNGLVVFFDGRAGGAIASTIAGGFGQPGSMGGARTDNWGTDIDGGPGVTVPGGGASILSPGFNPDMSMELNAGGATGNYFINLIDMTVPNEPLPNRDVLLGQNQFGAAAVTQTYVREPNPPGTPFGTVTHAFNGTNTAGVLGYDFGSPPGPLGDPMSATTGFEAEFSSLMLNQDPLQEIRMMPFITNGGGDFLSNQFLPGLNGQTNLGGPGDPGGAPLFDVRTTPNPNTGYLTIPLPTYIGGHGVWDSGSNWNTGHPANGVNASAVIAGSGGSIKMIDPITLGGLSFRTTNNSALSGPAPITLDTHPRYDGSPRPARIEVVSASHFISTPMTWNQDVIVTIATNSFLTITNVTIASGKGMIKNGGGLIAMNTLRMSTLDIEQGTVRVNIGGTNNQLVKVSKIDTLLIAGGPSAPTAQLNLTNNAAVISNTSKSDATIDDVRTYIAAGYNGGAWNGNGIMSTSANAGQFALGYATPPQIGIAGTFLGQSIAPTDALIRFTCYGDADLSGNVNLNDFNRLAANFGSTDAVWSQGDFDYDRKVNLNDFNKLAGNFGLTAGPDGPTPQDWANLAAAVPEPGGLGVLALAAFLRRRQRRRS